MGKKKQKKNEKQRGALKKRKNVKRRRKQRRQNLRSHRESSSPQLQLLSSPFPPQAPRDLAPLEEITHVRIPRIRRSLSRKNGTPESENWKVIFSTSVLI